MSGLKRKSQLDVPMGSSSRRKFEDPVENPPPTASSFSKKDRYINFNNSRREAKEDPALTAARLVAANISKTIEKEVTKPLNEARKKLLRPNDMSGRAANFGAKFESEDKAKRILSTHPDLGLKTEREVNEKTHAFWKEPISGDIVEKTQEKDGSLLRLQKSTGIVAVADVDTVDLSTVNSRTFFNAGWRKDRSIEEICRAAENYYHRQ